MMKRVQISAADWDSPKKAHEALAKALDFPAYYGQNLDALHDCLTDLGDTELVIEDCAFAGENMEKWPSFLAVFFDSAAENKRLKIKLLPGNGDYGE